MNSKKEIKDLQFEEILLVVFIITGCFNIYANEEQQKYFKYNNELDLQISDRIFAFTLFISVIIYFYYVYRNYKNVKNCTDNQKYYNLCQIRLLGSILVTVGFILVLYFELNKRNAIGTPI